MSFVHDGRLDVEMSGTIYSQVYLINVQLRHLDYKYKLTEGLHHTIHKVLFSCVLYRINMCLLEDNSNGIVLAI